KKKVGIYIGSGSPPDDIEAGISVDMRGRDIGIMISGSADNPEDVPSIPVIFDALAKKYPEHKNVFDSYKTLYEVSSNRDEEYGVINSLGKWLKDHVDRVEINLGIAKISFKP
ncbi:MAG: hypothetical protein KAU84_01895, partial [Thermoplasmatales archaeon]|nr:hypothetical protein [Thermoplasmatales archaeon]